MPFIDLYLEQINNTEIRLMAKAQTEPQRFLVADVVLDWDPTKLRLVGVHEDTAHPLIWDSLSRLPLANDDYTGINEANPPADGNAMYYSYAQLGEFLIVNQPVELAVFQFELLQPQVVTEVRLLPSLTVLYLGETVIYGGAGLRVTGNLGNVTISTLIGDFNRNGSVGSEDMAMILADWGTLSFGPNQHDLDGNGIIGSGDLSILLANWSSYGK
jgi:hypothetical protein